MRTIWFLASLWWWWLLPGTASFAIIAFLVGVSRTKYRILKFGVYPTGALLLLLVVAGESVKADLYGWHLTPWIPVDTLIRIGGGLLPWILPVCAFYALRRILVFIIVRRIPVREAYYDGEIVEVEFDVEDLYEGEEITHEEQREQREEDTEPRCVWCGSRLRGDPLECSECGAGT